MLSWTFFLEALLRSTALLLGCVLLLRLSKRRSAALRHRLLLWVFALLVTLPIFCVFLPPIAIPVLQSASARRASVTARQVSSKAVTEPSVYEINWPAVIWVLGFTISFAPALLGTLSVLRMLRSARKFHSLTLDQALLSLGQNG